MNINLFQISPTHATVCNLPEIFIKRTYLAKEIGLDKTEGNTPITMLFYSPVFIFLIFVDLQKHKKNKDLLEKEPVPTVSKTKTRFLSVCYQYFFIATPDPVPTVSQVTHY